MQKQKHFSRVQMTFDFSWRSSLTDVIVFLRYFWSPNKITWPNYDQLVNEARDTPNKVL